MNRDIWEKNEIHADIKDVKSKEITVLEVIFLERDPVTSAVITVNDKDTYIGRTIRHPKDTPDPWEGRKQAAKKALNIGNLSSLFPWDRENAVRMRSLYSSIRKILSHQQGAQLLGIKRV